MSLHIPEPCHADWATMSPTDKGRFCASCQKEVVDLASVSAPQARARLAAAQARSAEKAAALRAAKASAAAIAEVGICVHGVADRKRKVLLGNTRRYVLTNGLAVILAFGAWAGLSAADAPVAPPAPEVMQTKIGDMQVVEPVVPAKGEELQELGGKPCVAPPAPAELPAKRGEPVAKAPEPMSPITGAVPSGPPPDVKPVPKKP